MQVRLMAAMPSLIPTRSTEPVDQSASPPGTLPEQIHPPSADQIVGERGSREALLHDPANDLGRGHAAFQTKNQYSWCSSNDD